ncbi:MAG: pilin [Elusimicrobiaceae bacterium]|nr:pilin [Elusimicrobiaceae bacterium]
MMNKKAFTLIEMLTVVMIIGILTAVVLPQYRRAIQKAQATEAIAMLRVINDSGERLASEFGYKTFKSFATDPTDKDKATFRKMDMFDESTIACDIVGGYTLACEHFHYYLNGNDGQFNYISAVKQNNPYSGTEIRLYWGDMPQLKCAGNADACDLYNLTCEGNKCNED